MEQKITIRNEEKSDWTTVEDISQGKPFYNLYVPGCAEHYLVHIMRGNMKISLKNWILF